MISHMDRSLENKTSSVEGDTNAFVAKQISDILDLTGPTKMEQSKSP